MFLFLVYRIDIAAYPHSVNSLNTDRNNEDDDARTPENLIDGENDYADGSHCWIAPILPNIVRRKFRKNATGVNVYPVDQSNLRYFRSTNLNIDD